VARELLCFDRVMIGDRVMTGYVVDVERCIRCGACAILAPGLFEVVRKVRLVRQPATASEATAAAAAALVCPARAIAEAEATA
jgi:ferredoxin